MLVILSVLLLVAAALVMLILRVVRPTFGYHWLIAAGGAFAAWIVMLLVGLNLPVSFQLSAWGQKTLYPHSFILVADQVSWPFIAGLATLILAAILTDVVREADLDDMKNKIENLSDGDISKTIHDTIDPTGDLASDLDMTEIQQDMDSMGNETVDVEQINTVETPAPSRSVGEEAKTPQPNTDKDT